MKSIILGIIEYNAYSSIEKYKYRPDTKVLTTMQGL